MGEGVESERLRRVDRPAQPEHESARRGARLAFVLGVREGADRLGLREVDPPVEEGAPRELARSGTPPSGFLEGARERREERHGPGHVELAGVLSRVAPGGHEEPRARGDARPAGDRHLALDAAARSRDGGAEDARHEIERPRPRETDDPARAAPRGRGDREDRVVLVHTLAGTPGAAAPGATMPRRFLIQRCSSMPMIEDVM